MTAEYAQQVIDDLSPDGDGWINTHSNEVYNAVTAAIQSAVEAERKRLKEGWHQNNHHSILLEDHKQILEEQCKSCEEATALLVKLERESAVEAELRRLVPLVCDDCDTGDEPERNPSDDGTWGHNRPAPIGGYCEASPLHEALREKEKRDAG